MRKGGGVSIHILNKFDARVFIPNSQTDRNLEILWVQFKTENHICYLGFWVRYIIRLIQYTVNQRYC